MRGHALHYLSLIHLGTQALQGISASYPGTCREHKLQGALAPQVGLIHSQLWNVLCQPSLEPGTYKRVAMTTHPTSPKTSDPRRA